MARFNLESYETVQERLDSFWIRYPDGRVNTQLIHQGDKTFVVVASLYRDTLAESVPFAMGMAEEVIDSSPVNKTSALENCETSAIGRALRNGGIGKQASREEMEKVERRTVVEAPQQILNPNEIVAEAEAAKTIDELRGVWAKANDLTLTQSQTYKDSNGFTVNGTVADYLKAIAAQLTNKQETTEGEN